MTTTGKNYFTPKELSCSCCGENRFNPATLAKFNELRGLVGKSLPMSSGYRCPAYNTARGYTQTHATGQAGDLYVSGITAFLVNKYAAQVGFTGIGVRQKGSSRIIHLDDLHANLPSRPRPHIWSY